MEVIMQKHQWKVLLIIFCFFSTATWSQKFSSFEFENLSNFDSKTYDRPQINIYSNSFKSDSKIGFYNFALVNQFWAQAYGGIIYKPNSWLSVSVGAGLETNETPYRFNFSVYIMKPKYSIIQIYEYGGSGFWYNVQANYKISAKNSIGLIGKRYYGVGLNYEYSLPSFPLTLIIAPMYDFEFENNQLMIAGKYYL